MFKTYEDSDYQDVINGETIITTPAFDYETLVMWSLIMFVSIPAMMALIVLV